MESTKTTIKGLNVAKTGTTVTVGFAECDGNVKPFKNESGLEVLTLNNDEIFGVLPNSNYLCSHNENFPGTILECKLYLNKYFLNNKEQY